MSVTTIYRARQIITMNPSNPTATHVAVREGRILGAGTLEELAGWGEYQLDETFAEHVLVPGFVEAHAHAGEGVTGLFPMVTYFDRPLPDGTISPAVQSYEDLKKRLTEAREAMKEEPLDKPLVMLGFDPIYFKDKPRLTAKDLGDACPDRPVFIYHASAHVATVNTRMMQISNITRDTLTEGVVKGPDGEPTGELQEQPAMSLAVTAMTLLGEQARSTAALWNFGYAARTAGVTTVTDLAGSLVLGDSVDVWSGIVNDPAFPARVCSYSLPAAIGSGGPSSAEEVVATIKALQMKRASAKLRFPGIKVIIDGSIQGWTAKVSWPGYYTGEDHGIWVETPERLAEMLLPFHKAGINIHVHCNGDLAADVFIETVEKLLIAWPWLDHRHTCQHAQFVTSAQLRRMAKLGMCVNFFANHIFYWGDEHYEQTLGPERANRMEPCATAKREGVSFSIHSDASVTPMDRLHVMWCAVNRSTHGGRVLGEHEKISAYDALHAVTLGAAYQMHMDAEIGSIEVGKYADFTVLEGSPLDVAPEQIKDIRVWGTVVGGVKYPNPPKAAS
ncbi:amidohydrolase [Polyangium aurulentum]|uniref:amidohydrolase n=1 Tax=Polyangium aurulentum TaxID=2567896 RepID=UPI0019809E0A|nr:amidohydrolase [Polyangium aurulentum]UQA59489.1 amidohydrolase [Polyangium aurulentum]